MPSMMLASLTSSKQPQFSTLGTMTLPRFSQESQETNCMSEALFDRAFKRARELDDHLATTGRIVGPLHGLPMSVKDQFDVKGVDTTLDYVGRSFRPAKHNAAMVLLLESLGAVIITKTAIPQSILWNETESPLWGVTTYPGRPHLTPGGSSGGEAALLALSGSLVGWGTDIGGSIRLPAALCGLFGLKPSSTRFPYSGVPVSHEGQSHVPSSVGPLTRDLSTLTTVTKECLLTEHWILDPNVTPLPWREDVYQTIQQRPLKIGIIFDDGVVKPHPEIETAVRLAADYLQTAGHEIVIWDASDHNDCIAIMDQMYRADGGEDIRRDVEAAGEPMIPHVAALVGSSKPISVYDYWQLNRQKIRAQESYNKKWNESANLPPWSAGDGSQKQQTQSSRLVDVLISPVAPHTAVPHRTARWTGYTKVWNFLDYAALSIPFGTLEQESSFGGRLPKMHAGDSRERYLRDYVPRNDMDKWNHKLYDPELMDGLPIGLQIIGRRFEEERVLGVAKVVENVIADHLKA
ncbi:acetamidase [Hortaea werneckii]|nr:acetamidase [Hortaea werneckii]KAI6986620.1 acetamidase [Hortaea werneckii]